MLTTSLPGCTWCGRAVQLRAHEGPSMLCLSRLPNLSQSYGERTHAPFPLQLLHAAVHPLLLYGWLCGEAFHRAVDICIPFSRYFFRCGSAFRQAFVARPNLDGRCGPAVRPKRHSRPTGPWTSSSALAHWLHCVASKSLLGVGRFLSASPSPPTLNN